MLTQSEETDSLLIYPRPIELLRIHIHWHAVVVGASQTDFRRVLDS